MSELVRALTFDVFGTTVDWRSGVAAEARRIGEAAGIDGDWERLADAWRALYVPSMDRVRRGDLPWTNFDQLHRMSLDQVLAALGLDAFDPAARDEMTHAWERLPPWPDAAPGLGRLARRFTVATLSNGNRSQQEALIRFADLPFQRLLSAEDFRHYKPDPEVYLGAASALGLEPSEVMMVAAHKGDLRAAQAAGLRAAFVERPLEKGTAGGADRLPDPDAEIEATDFLDLADQLGC
ncbi:MAG: haloacid dehalogenase type II [Chloroflexi bacterium]|nr:MAG: haloacid dehalogenase type II [Chloroflexota bacterium]TME03535.1 MAG: haloacid dehalogenase type II [Chloroflexota bacterium]TME41778.1 MAG: haloacid dehalogenase type II [Chloroflexota bacterium]TME51215.1 MAG: haloacid dehalogenase type II [Chloroflexota bacterium]